MLDLLELELRMLVSTVGAGNQNTGTLEEQSI